MLGRVSVDDVKNGRVSRATARLVVVMRFYPRFLKKELIDEYVRVLAPQAELFSDFKARDRKSDNHNSSFYLSEYESRFFLSEPGVKRLKEFAELSKKEEVRFVCQCRDFDRCHCDLLLLWAEYKFDAPIKKLIFDYPIFRERLPLL